MAETFNPFAAKERSKIETPWGTFQVAPPNNTRLALIKELQEQALELDDDAMEESVELAIRMASAGLENGGKLEASLLTAWNAGEVTTDQINAMSTFIAGEIAGEVEAGNG